MPQTLSTVRLRWKAWLSDSPPRTFCVGVAASFTVDPVVPYLGCALLDAGFSPTVEVAPAEQLHHVCTSPQTAFSRQPDALILLWRIEDLSETLVARHAEGDDAALPLILEAVGSLADAVSHLRRSTAAIVVATIPPAPCLPWLSTSDLIAPGRLATLHRKVVELWTERVATPRGPVKTFDLAAVVHDFGGKAAFDRRKWYLYRQPYAEGLWAAAGRRIARVLASGIVPPRKCVVVDCDNTLWGGIVGEDGLAGLQIGGSFPGNAYADFQRSLLALNRRGVLLAIASKNNPDDVFEVFERHDGMVLSASNLSAHVVGWEAKSRSLQAIARQLNIGLDSLVFVDDSPHEIAEVHAALPEVACLQVPEEIADLPALLLESGLFDTAASTAEDDRRAAMIAEEQLRKANCETEGKDRYLANLGMRVHVMPAGQEHLARVVQLINKTNQFNLTTIRRSHEEVEALVANGHTVYAMTVRDRFGDYGLVGVAIVDNRANDWRLDTFLLSCRVLGRGVETAFLGVIAGYARAAGAERLHADFVPTAKNAPAASFLPDHGMSPTPDGGWFVRCDGVPPIPEFIDVEAAG